MRDHPIFDGLTVAYAHKFGPDSYFVAPDFPFANGVGPTNWLADWEHDRGIGRDSDFFTDHTGHIDVYLDTRRSQLAAERHRDDRGADKYID